MKSLRQKWIKICQYCWQNDFAVAGIIYLIALTIAILWIPINAGVASDHSVSEYEIYRQILDNRGWVDIPASTVVSCLFSTFIPAMLQLWLGFGDETIIFKTFPLIPFAMMPSFIYLIARLQLNRGYSLCAVGLVLASSIFITPNGRVGIALGFLSGMIWAVLTKRIKLSVLFTIFIPFSHYATNYITIGLLAIPFAYHLVMWIKKRNNLQFVAIPLLVLVALTIFWHGFVVTTPAESARRFTRYSAESALTITTPPKDTSPQGTSPKDTSQPAEITPQGNFYLLEDREKLVQYAFGEGLADFTVKRKVGWVASWLTIILLSFGLLQALHKRLFSQTHRIIAVAAYGLLVSSVAIPFISINYGVGRVYYVGLITLAPMFGQGLRVFGKYGMWIGLFLLVLLSWSTSGIMGGF